MLSYYRLIHISNVRDDENNFSKYFRWHIKNSFASVNPSSGVVEII